MFLIIDNYDSFVHNIARYFAIEGETCEVIRDIDVSVRILEQLAPEAIVISPGPGSPLDCPGSLAAIQWAKGRIPLLGICLGHQCIGYSYGLDVTRANEPMHGRASTVHHHGEGLFHGLPSPIEAGRYHSLIVPGIKPGIQLRVDASTELGEIMALTDEEGLTFGIQFHPESVLTPKGRLLIRNFIELVRQP